MGFWPYRSAHPRPDTGAPKSCALLGLFAVMLLVLSWRLAAGERNRLIAEMAALADWALQNTSDRLEEWLVNPTPANAARAAEAWETVKTVNQSIGNLIGESMQWHQAAPIDQLLFELAIQKPPVPDDHCRINRAIAALQEWRTAAQRLKEAKDWRAITIYGEFVSSHVGRFAVREGCSGNVRPAQP